MRDRFETGVDHLDVFSCPECKTNVNVRMIHDENSEMIECRSCGFSVSGCQGWAVVAKWNWNSIEKIGGVSLTERVLYENLWDEAFHSEIAVERRLERQKILEDLVLKRCPIRRGDIVQYEKDPVGPFLVAAVEAIWAYNTGPIWIARLNNPGKYFRATGSNHELWENTERQYSVNSVFVQPYRWMNIQTGMRCIVGKQTGVVDKVDDKKKVASVLFGDGTSSEIRKLPDLRVRLDQLLKTTAEFS